MTRDPQVTTLGDPADPPTLLLPRAGGWDPEFGRRLVDGSRCVVQYDDNGGRPVDVLDALGIDAAHVVAGSETIPDALRLAAAHPERVRSLTLISPTGGTADIVRRVDAAAPIALSTLIVHDSGDEPATVARTIAEGIVTSRLLPWNGRDWDLVVPAVLALGVDVIAQRSRYRATAESDPIGWFEDLYADAESGTARVPWDFGLPNPLLREWASRDRLNGRGQDAIVVGCALGRDAEFVAELGFRTTGFDVSESAIRAARRRYPQSAVTYLAADLFDLPAAWERAYDLVVECITIQALPKTLHQKAIASIALLVKPGGRLIVIALRPSADPAEDASGPPWPLTRAEVEAFEEHGLVPIRIDELTDDGYAGRRDRWRAEFHRPA